MRIFVNLVTVLTVIMISACSSVEVKTTDVVKIQHNMQDIPDQELLDIGIKIFDPGLDKLDELDEDELVFPEIRIAEASYFPYKLMEAIQASSAWGAVRVIPSSYDAIDVIVSGTIIRSDGERMNITVSVADSKGRHWFTKEYHHMASRYSYDKKMRRQKEPFQNIYNQITNDINKYRRSLNSEQLAELRQISTLKFAKAFAPDIYSEHLGRDNNGQVTINRLPAENDPIYQRISRVRDRDHLFIDTLQEYYGSYYQEMKTPYLQWRHESYNEVLALRNMQRKATNQKLIGAAAIIAGVLGAGNGNGSVRTASVLGATAGAYVLKAGYDREADAQIHIEALQELGDSLEASIEEHVIELEDRTVTLTGTVEDQYKQWREILQELYRIEVGS